MRRVKMRTGMQTRRPSSASLCSTYGLPERVTQDHLRCYAACDHTRPRPPLHERAATTREGEG